MSRAIVVLALLVAFTAALRLAAAWQATAPPTIDCSLCHD
jgi:hypothetical protein